MENIVFLDIDGVLVTHDSLKLQKVNCRLAARETPLVDNIEYKKNPLNKNTSYFDITCVKLLNQFINEINAKIVISSTWRKSNNWKENINNEFLLLGFDNFYDIIIDRTGESSVSKDENGNYIERGLEIQEWLNNNKINKYIIIDDDNDFLEHQKQYHIQTDLKYGFNYESYDQALKILK